MRYLFILLTQDRTFTVPFFDFMISKGNIIECCALTFTGIICAKFRRNDPVNFHSVRLKHTENDPWQFFKEKSFRIYKNASTFIIFFLLYFSSKKKIPENNASEYQDFTCSFHPFLYPCPHIQK